MWNLQFFVFGNVLFFFGGVEGGNREDVLLLWNTFTVIFLPIPLPP